MSVALTPVEKQPYIHRVRRKKGDGWVVIIGSGNARHYKCFRDGDSGGSAQAFEAAKAHRDHVLPFHLKEIQESTNRQVRRKSAQLRIRLLPAELEAFEKRRAQDWESGKAYAENLSSWVRHQIQPLVCPDPDKQLSLISRGLYCKVEELARLLEKTPEAVIEECVTGIVNRIHHSQAQRPLIVAEWRLRQQYSQSRNI